MPRKPTQREGSPFTGLGPVFMKEFADHLSSARMMVLMLFVIVFGAFPVASSLQQLRTVTEQDSYLFLRIFTSAPESLPISFVFALNFIIPIMAIGLGFDAVNSEFNRRTLSRVLSQPIYRDALLLGKFLGGLATLAVALAALWLIVFGAGLLLLGLPPRAFVVFGLCVGYADPKAKNEVKPRLPQSTVLHHDRYDATPEAKDRPAYDAEMAKFSQRNEMQATTWTQRIVARMAPIKAMGGRETIRATLAKLGFEIR